MTLNLNKLKNYVLKNEENDGNSNEKNPEIGFKVGYFSNEKQLKVKIISARYLPRYHGNNKAKGFLTKVFKDQVNGK